MYRMPSTQPSSQPQPPRFKTAPISCTMGKAVLRPHNTNTVPTPTTKPASSTPAMPPAPVRVSYAALQAACDHPCDAAAASLAGQLHAAYGPDGLGLILVDAVPDLAARRAALLPLASSLARLPDATRAQLEDPECSYNIGWSHGKETLANGVPGGVPRPLRSPAPLPYPVASLAGAPPRSAARLDATPDPHFTPRHASTAALYTPARFPTPSDSLLSPAASLTVRGWDGRVFPDLLKASFYANPMLDVPTTDPTLIAEYV